MFELSPLVTAARALGLLGAGAVEVVAVEARADDRRPGPVGRQAPKGAGDLVDDRHRVTLLDQSDGEPRPDPPTPDDHDVHRHHATRRAGPGNTAQPARATAARPHRVVHGMWLPEGVSEVPVPDTGEAVAPGGAPAVAPAVVRARGQAPGRDVTPEALPSYDALELPENARYRLKNVFLGPPLASERQAVERLGKPTALAVLSSDVISSSAYATEQILVQLVKYIGVAAFALVVPVTVAVVVVLLFVTASYLEVVKVYTKAGGAYVVARENFGLGVAQIAAVSLLIDYTLTVAVSVAAGVDALIVGVPRLGHHDGTMWIAIGLVLLIAYGNLRGIREAGRVFAIPTYFFIANMALLIIVGSVKAVLGDLHRPFDSSGRGGVGGHAGTGPAHGGVAVHRGEGRSPRGARR